MAQHAFRCEHHQRLAPVSKGLASQQVKILSGIRGLDDLNVVFGCKLNEALDTGTGMLRALAFVSVRQQHDESGEQVPLGFTGADELIDDGLRHVDEVSELSLPEDKRFGVVAAVAIFKSQHTGFRES